MVNSYSSFSGIFFLFLKHNKNKKGSYKNVRPFNFLKIYQPVSRILSYPAKLALYRIEVIIYLAATLLLQSCCLPFGIGRAALRRRFTWHYSTQGLPNYCITAKTRELLPHVFTLTPTLCRDGNFLWPCLFRHGQCFH